MSTPKISISLPSLYPDCCARTLRNIRDATRNSYEVILVSPFGPPADCRENVVWVEEPAGTGTGCNAGHVAAFAAMSGEYVSAWADDHFYVDGWDIAAIENYERRESAFSLEKPFLLGLRHTWPSHVGTLFGIYYAYFPFIRRTMATKIGFYDKGYRQGFVDSDFSLRIWDAGGRCEWSERRLIVVRPDDDGRKERVYYAESDYALCVERWQSKYGQGWDTTHLRGFNCDIVPESFNGFTQGNSIFQNLPSFRREIEIRQPR